MSHRSLLTNKAPKILTCAKPQQYFKEARIEKSSSRKDLCFWVLPNEVNTKNIQRKFHRIFKRMVSLGALATWTKRDRESN